MRNEYIANIFALRYCSDRQAVRDLGRNVFQTVNGKIDFMIKQRAVKFFGEQSFVADL